MTVRYVGSGGNDSNDGLSWANRKLTLNGVEDTPVVSGDIVYVGPGVYRELLTCDVSGASAITYIGDVTGDHTDGVGGIVRITGSNDDQTASRANCIAAVGKNYRTFQGFTLDITSSHSISDNNGDNWTVQDCIFRNLYTNAVYGFICTSNSTPANITIQRCMFDGGAGGVQFTYTSDVAASACVIQNCIFLGVFTSINSTNIDSVVIKNCTIIGSGGACIQTSSGLAVSTSIMVNNCILYGNTRAMTASAAGEITSNYNTRCSNTYADTNVTAGAQDVTYPPLFNSPLLLDGFRFPWFFGELSKWSQVARITGTGEATDDLFGLERPITSAKKSWGAIQYTGAARETTTIDGASGASIKLPDAGEQFLMRVPVSNESTTISIYCYREANYAGTLPQMIIRQPGQSDRTTTDTGNASAWNQLTDTFTPAASPPYVDIFIKSNNTATSSSYATYFDTAAVS